jgi:hypothetical protein
MRPAPRIEPGAIVARLRFNPNGGHQLEVAVPSGVVAMVFEEHHIRQLERVIAQYHERVRFEEARPGTVSERQKSIPLDVWG